jgi:hypothetical protein
VNQSEKGNAVFLAHKVTVTISWMPRRVRLAAQAGSTGNLTNTRSDDIQKLVLSNPGALLAL